DAQTGAGRLVHLAENHSHFRFRQIFLIDYARLAHFAIEIVALPRAFAHPGENRHTAMTFGDVVNQLHDDNGLADARATERSDLAAFGERTDYVCDFDSVMQYVDLV